jgi:hypothetical protein
MIMMLGRGKVEKQLLPASFSPGNWDIICRIGGDTRARGKPVFASLLVFSSRRSRYLIDSIVVGIDLSEQSTTSYSSIALKAI